MKSWIDILNFSFSVTGISLTILGINLLHVIKYIDLKTKIFFRIFFTVILLYVISVLISDVTYTIPGAGYSRISKLTLFLESMFSSFLIPLLAYYFFICCKLNWKKNASFIVICTYELIYLVLLIITQFTTQIYYYDDNGIYYRGPLYPILLVPTVLSMTTMLITLINKKKLLTKKQFIAFLLYILIPIISMLIQMFLYGLNIVVIGTLFAATVLFSSIIIDQINAYMAQKDLNDLYQTDILLLQMRPHFIYNSLSSIYYLCDLDSKKAQTVVRDFSIYLKKNFSAMSKRELIPFEDELEHTRAYLAIEKARYEKLLFVEYDIQNTQFQLPPLTLQPIVENAVKHGVDPDFPSLHIWVRTYREGLRNIIVVENTGPDFTPIAEDDKEVHVGTTNVRKRLELMCDGTLKIAPRPEGGTVVTIEI